MLRGHASRCEARCASRCEARSASDRSMRRGVPRCEARCASDRSMTASGRCLAECFEENVYLENVLVIITFASTANSRT